MFWRFVIKVKVTGCRESLIYISSMFVNYVELFMNFSLLSYFLYRKKISLYFILNPIFFSFLKTNLTPLVHNRMEFRSYILPTKQISDNSKFTDKIPITYQAPAVALFHGPSYLRSSRSNPAVVFSCCTLPYSNAPLPRPLLSQTQHSALITDYRAMGIGVLICRFQMKCFPWESPQENCWFLLPYFIGLAVTVSTFFNIHLCFIRMLYAKSLENI